MPKTLGPRLIVEWSEGIAIIGFADAALASEETLRAVVEELCDLAERHLPGNLLINFGNVQVMSARMLAVLVWIARKVERGDGSMKLCGIRAHLLDHFKITRLQRYFEIYRDEASALRAFSRPKPEPRPKVEVEAGAGAL